MEAMIRGVRSEGEASEQSQQICRRGEFLIPLTRIFASEQFGELFCAACRSASFFGANPTAG
jgi:hypothetical protein